MNTKTAFITGATSGIGKATAEIFAKNGINLILCGRRNDRLIQLKKELSKLTDVTTLQFDVSKKKEVFKAIHNLPVAFQHVDILINNAGNAHGLSSIQEGSIDDWDAMLDINVKGLLYVSKAILPQMVERNNRFLLVPEDEFSNPDIQSESNTLGKSAFWSLNKEYVLGNATSILGFPLERPFIGQLNTNEIISLNSSEPLPYGSCHSNIAHWSPDSQFVAYATNEQDSTCADTTLQNQAIVVVTISGTNVISDLVALVGNNQPIGWLSLP